MLWAERETSAGGVVFRRGTGDDVRFLLIRDSYRNWGLPKGHLELDEPPADAARREVAEETGLRDLILHGPIQVIDWYFRFRGKTILQATVSAPLVMPDVITGLALLLLFVAMQSIIGWPAGRGVLTIVIAHSTFCTAYVCVVVQSRLTDLDLSLEEAAMDLGATPVRVFFDVTLPIIAPALVSGWLLAFTLSLDDLVIASFVSGPGATTLPMRLYSQMRLGVTPEINAASTVMIAVVGIAVIGASLLQKRQAR